MKKKIVLTVGGTGGHVFPALSLASQLKREIPNLELLFVGGHLSSNRYFTKTAFQYYSVDCAALSFRNPLAWPKHCVQISHGFFQSLRILKEFAPNLIVGFGSYHTFPTLLAAKWASIPFVLHEANSVPGKVNRLFSRYACLTGVSFPMAAERLVGKAQHIPLPLREGFQKGVVTPQQAREYFHLSPNKTTLLIFGGSQGARGINNLFSNAMPYLSNHQALQLIHCTGSTDTVGAFQDTYRRYNLDATVLSFESRMDLAWQAADLMISRSGSGTLTEQLEFEVPGILIPYPNAADNHQEKNADYMAKDVGGALRFRESEISPVMLAAEIENLLASDGLKLLRNAIQVYKQRASLPSLASVVRSVLLR